MPIDFNTFGTQQFFAFSIENWEQKNISLTYDMSFANKFSNRNSLSLICDIGKRQLKLTRVLSKFGVTYDMFKFVYTHDLMLNKTTNKIKMLKN